MKYDSKICRLLTSRQLTGDVFDFVLEAPELAALAHPGQFAQIRLPGHALRRPISICGIDKEKGTLRFVFQIRGRARRNWPSSSPAAKLKSWRPWETVFPLTPQNAPCWWAAA